MSEEPVPPEKTVKPLPEPSDDTLFLYGTLRHLPLLEIVAGEPVEVEEGWLPDHLAHRADGHTYPMIVPTPGRIAEGLIVRLSPTARARLDFYEGGHGYGTRRLWAETEERRVSVQVYWPPEDGPAPAEPWDLRKWVHDWGALQEIAAKDAMRAFGHQSAEQVAARFTSLMVRAQAWMNAQAPMPTTLRRAAQPDDVVLEHIETGYGGFFAVEDLTLKARRFDGSYGAPMERAGFVSGDAAVVLPYDPERDRVMLIEQFRVGPYLRGDPQPWSLEAIAGRVDAGETPQQAAHREAAEEAGLTFERLIPIGGHYPSPGAKTEFLHCFIGVADLPDTAAGLGGLVAEGEDIRSHVIRFDDLMALVDSGEVGAGPLILMALQLARQRAELRAERQVVFTRSGRGPGM